MDQAYASLLNRAPDWFMYVIAELHAVVEEPPGGSAGIYTDSQTFGTSFNPAYVVTDEDVIDMVGGLAHKACRAPMA